MIQGKKKQVSPTTVWIVLFFIFMPILAWLCNDTNTPMSLGHMYFGELAAVTVVIIACAVFAKLL